MRCWTCHDKGWVRVPGPSCAVAPFAVDACGECTVRAEFAWQAARHGLGNEGVEAPGSAFGSASQTERKRA